MKTDLFIPKTIVVGAQKRSDTYTGELGYVIYRDNKGVLRKEKSWEGWRDKSIEPRTFDNTPTNGFTFNKGVQRYSDWHSSGRSMVRVWDPRGYEFEVSIENLIGILMHSDVSKRDIVQDCVYAWYGTELILLPTNSQVYQDSVKFTEKQDMKVGAKELGIGYTYEIKKSREPVVYLGRFDTYGEVREGTTRYGHTLSRKQVKKKPQHVFRTASGRIEFKSPTQYIAQVVSEECHPNYADYLQQFYRMYESQPIAGIKLVTDHSYKNPRNPTILGHYANHYGPEVQGYYLVHQVVDYSLKGSHWTQIDDTHFLEVAIELEMYPSDYGYNTTRCNPPKLVVGYSRVAVYDTETAELRYSYAGEQNSWRSSTIPPRELPDFNARTPAVVEKIDQIRKDYQTAMANWVPGNYQNAPLTEEVYQTLENLIRVAKSHNFGELRYVLQNGHMTTGNLY